MSLCLETVEKEASVIIIRNSKEIIYNNLISTFSGF